MSNPALTEFCLATLSSRFGTELFTLRSERGLRAGSHSAERKNRKSLTVVNNHPDTLADVKAHIFTIFNLDGSAVTNQDVEVKAVPSAVTDLGLFRPLFDNLSLSLFHQAGVA